MSVQNKTTQKTYFENGDKPTGTDFSNLIDSQIGIEDTITIIKQLLADTTALKAIVVTSLADKTFAYVEAEGEYYYDSSASDTEDLPDIVQPDSGSGRWFLKTGLGSGANANSLVRTVVSNPSLGFFSSFSS